MKRPEIKGKIKKIEPDSGYEDKIFTQNVLVKLKDGTILRIFDPDMLIKQEMAGNEIIMALTAFLPQIQKSPGQQYSVGSDISVSENENQQSMHFKGRIEEFNEKRDRFILNFGAGLMEVDIHAFQAEGFEVGDFVKFDVYRIDLNVLYPEN